MRGTAAAGDDRPAVLIFRKRLLPWSETFIAAQGGALSRYRPVFVGYQCAGAGAHYLAGHDRVVLAEHARFPGLAKGALKAFGWVAPRWRGELGARRPVLLHVHFGVNAAVALPIARTFDLPLIVTYHGMDITVERTTAADRRRRERIFAAADRIIAVSEFIAGRLREAGCPAEKLTVHYIGVDTERFVPAPAESRASSQILFVGRLVPKKGLIHLIRAMPRVQRAVPDAELVVAGDGGLRSQLEAEAGRLGIRCRFLGVRTPDQVQALMRRATLLCAPSVVAENGDAEGLGMVIVEAQASGIPVVTFRSGGAAESVVHGETGFVAPERDEDALAAHLTAILADAELRDRMSAAARAHIVENFDLRRQTAALERIYDQVRGQATPLPL
ncbi:MAG TPA: glycosyltransferase [Longimicrobiales bacterium]